MRVLDKDQSLLLWGAERPFQIQLLAGLGRLGMDVFALVESPAGKILVDQLHPKNHEGLTLTENFSGAILWAPAEELFTNAPLSEKSLADLEALQRVGAEQKLYFLLPQNAYGQFTGRGTHLYFPALVGFGDRNVFEKALESTQSSGPRAIPIEGEFLSVFDAVSFVLSAIKAANLPDKLWIEGHAIPATSLNEGFQEVTEAGVFAPISYLWQKLRGKTPEFRAAVSPLPPGVTKANDFFPTILTPWERFFRDAYRIYKHTSDTKLLLHFRPSRSP